MAGIMKAAQPAGIGGFVDHYPEIAAAFPERDPSGATRRSRSGSTSEYAPARPHPAIARVVIGTTAGADTGAELFVAHR